MGGLDPSIHPVATPLFDLVLTLWDPYHKALFIASRNPDGGHWLRAWPISTIIYLILLGKDDLRDNRIVDESPYFRWHRILRIHKINFASAEFNNYSRLIEITCFAVGSHESCGTVTRVTIDLINTTPTVEAWATGTLVDIWIEFIQ